MFRTLRDCGGVYVGTLGKLPGTQKFCLVPKIELQKLGSARLTACAHSKSLTLKWRKTNGSSLVTEALGFSNTF